MINLTSILYEADRYKKEMAEDLPRWQDKIIAYEKEGGYFIHFSLYPRIGLYLVNKFNTPIGFYAYPLNKEKLANFALDRPYAIIFKPKPEMKILELKKYSESDYEADIKKLVDMGNSLDVIKKAASRAKYKTPAGKIWNITRVLSGAAKVKDQVLKEEEERVGGGPTGKWTVLLKKLGYDGVNDDCLSIIHPAEKCQAVFFSTSKLDLIEIIDITKKNIKGKEELFALSPERIFSLPIEKAIAELEASRSSRELVSANKRTPPNLLRYLANRHNKADFHNSNWEIIKNVVINPSTPLDVLLQIANGDVPDQLELLLQNPNTKTSPEIIQALLENEWAYNAHRNMAEGIEGITTPELLRALVVSASNTPDDVTLINVAANELTPTDVLDSLVEHPSTARLPFYIAANKKTLPETLAKIATTSNAEDVLTAVVNNNNTPVANLEALTKSNLKKVADAAAKKIEKLSKKTKKKVTKEGLIVKKFFEKLFTY